MAKTPDGKTRVDEDHIAEWSDHYFLRTRQAVERFGDMPVTYAVFMRRPVIFAPKLMIAWLQGVAESLYS